jgi:hypothetical protein
MHRVFASIGLAVGLLVAGTSAAASFAVDILVTSGSDGGFAFSYVHDATSACETISGIQFCKSGGDIDSIPSAQTLTGTYDDVTELLSLDSGQTLNVTGGLNIDITGGTIDLDELDDAVETDVFVGAITTSSHGTFHFLDHLFAGPANSYTPGSGSLMLWGNNWSNAGTPDPGQFPDNSPIPQYGIDLGLELSFRPIPEPGVAWLLGLAGLVALRARRVC